MDVQARSSRRLEVVARCGDVEVRAVVEADCETKGGGEMKTGALDVVRVVNGVADAALRMAVEGEASGKGRKSLCLCEDGIR